MNVEEIVYLESINSFYKKGDYMDELMIDREMEIIKRYCNSNKTALEVGCGSGSSTEKLNKLFYDLEVIEPSQQNIKLLKQKVPNIICHNVLLEDFKTDKRYDFIFFLNIIEHVLDPVKSLKDVESILNYGGLVFISCPNCMSLNRRAGYKMGLLSDYTQMAPKDLLVGHRRLYTTDMLRDHCDQAGLKVLEMKGLYLKPLSESQMIKLGDEAVKAFYQLGEDIPQYCASLLAIATKKYY